MGPNCQVSSKSVNRKWVNGRGHRTNKQTNRQTDTQSNNKGRLELSGAREPILILVIISSSSSSTSSSSSSSSSSTSSSSSMNLLVLVIDEERMTLGHWLRLIISISFSAFETDGWVTRKATVLTRNVPFILKASLLKQQPFYGPLSGITRVSQYLKTGSTYVCHQLSFMSFLHLLRSTANSLFNLCAWQALFTTSLQVPFGGPLGLEPCFVYLISDHAFVFLTSFPPWASIHTLLAETSYAIFLLY